MEEPQKILSNSEAETTVNAILAADAIKKLANNLWVLAKQSEKNTKIEKDEKEILELKEKYNFRTKEEAKENLDRVNKTRKFLKSVGSFSILGQQGQKIDSFNRRILTIGESLEKIGTKKSGIFRSSIDDIGLSLKRVGGGSSGKGFGIVTGNLAKAGIQFAAIQAVIYTISRIWKSNLGGIQTTVIKIVGMASNFFNRFDVAFRKMLMTLNPIFKRVFQPMERIAKVLFDSFTPLIDVLMNSLQPALGSLGETLAGVMEIIEPAITWIIPKLAAVLGFTFKMIGFYLKIIGDVLKVLIAPIKLFVKNIKNLFDLLTGKVSFKDFFIKFKTDFVSYLTEIMNSLIRLWNDSPLGKMHQFSEIGGTQTSSDESGVVSVGENSQKSILQSMINENTKNAITNSTTTNKNYTDQRRSETTIYTQQLNPANARTIGNIFNNQVLENQMTI